MSACYSIKQQAKAKHTHHDDVVLRDAAGHGDVVCVRDVGVVAVVPISVGTGDEDGIVILLGGGGGGGGAREGQKCGGGFEQHVRSFFPVFLGL